jgi:hypothetical protein
LIILEFLADLLHNFLLFFCSASSIKEWSVNQLEDGTKNEVVPIGEEVRRDYGFINCKNAEEEGKLLRIYAGLILMLKHDLVRLHEACITGNLKELITTEYEKPREKFPDFGYAWFKENPDIVKNHYPLPEPGFSWSSDPGASTSTSSNATSSEAQATGPTPTTEIKVEPGTEGGPPEPMVEETSTEIKPEVKTEPTA